MQWIGQQVLFTVIWHLSQILLMYQSAHRIACSKENSHISFQWGLVGWGLSTEQWRQMIYYANACRIVWILFSFDKKLFMVLQCVPLSRNVLYTGKFWREILGTISEYPFTYLHNYCLLLFKKETYKPIDSIHILMGGQVFWNLAKFSHQNMSYPTCEESFELSASMRQLSQLFPCICTRPSLLSKCLS